MTDLNVVEWRLRFTRLAYFLLLISSYYRKIKPAVKRRQLNLAPHGLDAWNKAIYQLPLLEDGMEYIDLALL